MPAFLAMQNNAIGNKRTIWEAEKSKGIEEIGNRAHNDQTLQQ